MRDLKRHGEMVSRMSRVMRSAHNDLDTFIGTVRNVLKNEAWRRFTDSVHGETHEHDTWQSFVTAEPFVGLGARVEQIDNLVRDDIELVAMIDEAKKRKPGKPKGANGGNQHSKSLIDDNINNKRWSAAGTSKDAALRKLRKDAPELYKQVIAGEKSPHGAMLEAGFRKKTATIPLDKPESVARALKRKLEVAELAAVARELKATDESADQPKGVLTRFRDLWREASDAERHTIRELISEGED